MLFSIPAIVIAALPFFLSVDAVTIYTGTTSTTSSSSTASDATYTGYAAYDPTVLTAPTAPSPAVSSFTLTFPSTSDEVISEGLSLSIAQKGNFLGFSIEMSVATSVMGSSGTNLKVPFLNFMANIQNRAGSGPIIRVGGNSQEGTTLFVDGLEDGKAMDKIKVGTGATDTPLLNYSPELFYIMSNITSLVSAEWYFGLAFNESDVYNHSTNIATASTWATMILGDSLKGLSIGNEPDLYVDHSHRSDANWNITNYVSEFDETVQLVLSDGSLPSSAAFIGPSLCCQVVNFEFADLVTAGWLENNQDYLTAVTVQHYPTNNCAVNGVTIEAQDIFADFLNHTSAQYLAALYASDSLTVQAAGLELVMLETNTASCGGFAGLSDSFGAAMWMTDYALQMAYYNYSSALMHVGGQNVYYNPFTPPPSNESSTSQWTAGSVYYASLVVAEVFGKSNDSKIVDLTPTSDVDANYIYHPVYGVYENDALARAVLFNFIDDSTGASDLSVSISVADNAGPTEVHVRYLSSDSVSEQYDIYWANQTLGSSFEADGRLSGVVETINITCSDSTCVIPVAAPAIAVVYFSDTYLTESDVSVDATSTYGTSYVGTGTATIAASVLATSNGDEGSDGGGKTSSGSSSSATRTAEHGVVGMTCMMTLTLVVSSWVWFK